MSFLRSCFCVGKQLSTGEHFSFDEMPHNRKTHDLTTKVELVLSKAISCKTLSSTTPCQPTFKQTIDGLFTSFGVRASYDWEVKSKCNFYILFFKMGHLRPLLSLIFGLLKQTLIFLPQYMWKMSIQYPVHGFEPTTSWTWVSSHNH